MTVAHQNKEKHTNRLAEQSSVDQGSNIQSK